MLRTWRPERDRHVVIVIDTGRTAAARVGDGVRIGVGHHLQFATSLQFLFFLQLGLLSLEFTLLVHTTR